MTDDTDNQNPDPNDIPDMERAEFVEVMHYAVPNDNLAMNSVMSLQVPFTPGAEVSQPWRLVTAVPTMIGVSRVAPPVPGLIMLLSRTITKLVPVQREAPPAQREQQGNMTSFKRTLQ